jgi:acyl carrier protein
MMKKPDVETEIKIIISEVTKFPANDLTDEVLIREELGIDSIMAMEIMVKIEIKFNLQIIEEKLQSIKTIREFINFIEEEISLLVKN